MILSLDYLNACSALPEWISAFRVGPWNDPRVLVAVQVRECGSQITELLGSIAHINLVGLNEQSAKDVLLSQVASEYTTLVDPNSQFPRSISEQAKFPETSQQVVSQPVDDGSSKAIEVLLFYASSHDIWLFLEFEKHLKILQRQGIIASFTNVEIPRTFYDHNAFNEYINRAKIILLMISPDFMDSDFCYGSEMKYAVERHEQGEVFVIPILLRPVHWQEAPFGHLEALPSRGRYVISSHWNPDEAFFDITQGIREAIESLTMRLPSETPLIANSLESGESEEIAQDPPHVHEFTRELINQQHSMQYTLRELKGDYEIMRKDIEQLIQAQYKILQTLEDLLENRD